MRGQRDRLDFGSGDFFFVRRRRGCAQVRLAESAPRAGRVTPHGTHAVHDPSSAKPQEKFLRNPKTKKIMKHITLAILALSTFIVASCDKQKAAIDANTDAAKNAIEHQKDAVTDAAKELKAQTDVNATVDKANIEASKEAALAQLEADKKKAEAAADAEKAKVDAARK